MRLEFRTPLGVGKSAMPEPAGSRAVTYGDFDFRRLWVLVSTPDMRT